MSKNSPRVVIGKEKGIKVRCRHPAMTSGYIHHTFNSIKEAKKYYKDIMPQQRRRAKCFRLDNKKEIKIK